MKKLSRAGLLVVCLSIAAGHSLAFVMGYYLGHARAARYAEHIVAMWMDEPVTVAAVEEGTQCLDGKPGWHCVSGRYGHWGDATRTWLDPGRLCCWKWVVRRDGS